MGTLEDQGLAGITPPVDPGSAKLLTKGSGSTPGPWVVLDLRDTDRCLVSSNCLPDGSERATAEKNGGFMVAHTLGPQRAANATLIAAAPDLYEAARPLVAEIAGYEPSAGEDDDELVSVRLGALKALRAAIAKAGA